MAKTLKRGREAIDDVVASFNIAMEMQRILDESTSDFAEIVAIALRSAVGVGE